MFFCDCIIDILFFFHGPKAHKTNEKRWHLWSFVHFHCNTAWHQYENKKKNIVEQHLKPPHLTPFWRDNQEVLHLKIFVTFWNRQSLPSHTNWSGVRRWESKQGLCFSLELSFSFSLTDISVTFFFYLQLSAARTPFEERRLWVWLCAPLSSFVWSIMPFLPHCIVTWSRQHFAITSFEHTAAITSSDWPTQCWRSSATVPGHDSRAACWRLG